MGKAIESGIPREQPTETERAAWIGLIARIGIPAGVLVILMLPLFFVLVVGGAPDLGHPALELIGASQNLTAYKVYTLLETLTFVFLSTLLFALGMVVRAHHPVIGTLIALAGAGNLVGILANFERLALIGGLAAAYPHADADTRVVMEQTGAYFAQLYISHIYMAWLMQSAAGLLSSSVTPGIACFPRWLSRWLCSRYTSRFLWVCSASDSRSGQEAVYPPLELQRRREVERFQLLFWLELYLTGAVEGFVPPAPFDLVEMNPGEVLPRTYTSAELLGNLEHCRRDAGRRVPLHPDHGPGAGALARRHAGTAYEAG
jgi:hypothetical protein